MQLGIFARTFVRPNLEETLDAVKFYGLNCLQFNFSCVGLPTLPEEIDPALVIRVRTELEKRALRMVAVSGTCNLIHPDLAQRAKDLKRLQSLIAASRDLGTSVVTLCTGTRDPEDMWRAHPENDSMSAQRDLKASLETLLPVAIEQGVTLGIEPEPANVIATARQARRLLDALKSPSLKIVFDAVNLVMSDGLTEQRRILSEATHILGGDIVLAHAKDLRRDHDVITVAAGKGELDYSFYLALLEQAGFNGAVVLHSLTEAEAPASVAFLRSKLARANTPGSGDAHALFHSRQH